MQDPLLAMLGPRWAPRVRSVLVLVALGTATVQLARIFGAQIDIGQWLFWRYAVSWLGAAAFSLASLSVGHAVVRALSPKGYRADGHFVLSFATGVLVFGWAVFVVGLLGMLGRVAFFALPVALFLIGARSLTYELVAVRDEARTKGGLFAGWSVWELAALLVGGAALALVYVPTLVPDNVAYDARWYHLGLAEHYALEGAIRRFPEGPLTGTIPHLASLHYAWAWLLPGSELFDRVELCAHLEVVCFLATLGGVPVLVRQLVPGARARVAWVAVFLWPSLFVYDSTLTGAADHIAAMFTIPVHLALVRALRELRPRDCVLFALMLSGALLVKYTAIVLAPVPILALVLRGLWLLAKPPAGVSRLQPLRGALTTLGVGLAATSMHWLKNWIWYGDPAYPVLHKYLKLRPWNADGDHHYALYQSTNFTATGPWAERLTGAVRALYDHSYGLYTWEYFHGHIPVFGSLFTFSLLALPLLAGTKRIWLLVASIHASVFLWFLMSHQERYLQALLPTMAASAVAILILAWRTGRVARVGVVGLVGLQAVWGMGMAFWPMHKMTDKAGIELAVDFFAKTFKKTGEGRLSPFQPYPAIAAKLPPKSKVLLHHTHLRTGIGAMTVTDSIPIAYGLSYGRLGSSAAVDALLKSWGVTHVAWDGDQAHGADSIAGDLVFHTYVARYVVSVGKFGGMSLGTLPAKPPPDDGHAVLYMGCPGSYADGLYRLEDLTVPPAEPPGFPHQWPTPKRAVPAGAPPAVITASVAAATHAVIDRRCASSVAIPEFTVVARHGTVDYAVRTTGARPPELLSRH